MWGGKEFDIFGAEIRKAREPTACHISVGGEGNALYPVVSSLILSFRCSF